VVCEVDAARCGLARDEIVRVLHAENCLARRYFTPGCHRMEPYRTLYPGAGSRLPVTERLTDEVMVLPTGTSVGEREIDAVVALIRLAAAEAGRVRARLGELSA
jgi:dTDP-4-amino-4,6-dideoxygalactose transaminase